MQLKNRIHVSFLLNHFLLETTTDWYQVWQTTWATNRTKNRNKSSSSTIIKENNGKIHINNRINTTEKKNENKMQGSVVCVRNYRCRAWSLSLSISPSHSAIHERTQFFLSIKHKNISKYTPLTSFEKRKKINRAIQVIIFLHATKINERFWIKLTHEYNVCYRNGSHNTRRDEQQGKKLPSTEREQRAQYLVD